MLAQNLDFLKCVRFLRSFQHDSRRQWWNISSESHVHGRTWRSALQSTLVLYNWRLSAACRENVHKLKSAFIYILYLYNWYTYIIINSYSHVSLKMKRKKGQTYLVSSSFSFYYFLHFKACQGNAFLHSVGYRDARRRDFLMYSKIGKEKKAIQCKRITKINENSKKIKNMYIQDVLHDSKLKPV